MVEAREPQEVTSPGHLPGERELEYFTLSDGAVLFHRLRTATDLAPL